MLKPATYNIADSNIANLGSDLEKEVKKAAAECEPAWQGAGKEPGIKIWRIEKFKVISWPKEEYGKFFSGDSYIILNTYKKEGSDALLHNAHFWLGAHTTQDEAGTAAYKTVELDDILGGAPVQYREVQGHESETFLKLFPNGITIQAGGVDTGFRHVEPESYRARLLHIKGTRKNISAMEVPLEASSLNSNDVFILDQGLKVFQWAGKDAGIFEKNKAATLARAIDDERAGKAEVIVTAEGSDGDFPWDVLGGKPDSIPENAPEPDSQTGEKKLLKVSDATGELTTEEVASGSVKRDLLNSDDVFIFDTVGEVYVWIGTGASAGEKSKGLSIAQNYLSKAGKPAWTPISRILEGGENETFEANFDN